MEDSTKFRETTGWKPKKRKPKKKPNPIARALNLVTKPVTMVDKKKLMSKMKCRQKLNLNEGE